MKNTSVLAILGIVLFSLAIWLSGCNSPQLGETEAEVRRRHIRALRIDRLQLHEDIDKYLAYERPRRLSDKKIP